MTSWSQSVRLELVRDKTMTDVWKQMRRLPASKDRTALRREFQGWFSKTGRTRRSSGYRTSRSGPNDLHRKGCLQPQ